MKRAEIRRDMSSSRQNINEYKVLVSTDQESNGLISRQPLKCLNYLSPPELHGSMVDENLAMPVPLTIQQLKSTTCQPHALHTRFPDVERNEMKRSRFCGWHAVMQSTASCTKKKKSRVTRHSSHRQTQRKPEGHVSIFVSMNRIQNRDLRMLT